MESLRTGQVVFGRNIYPLSVAFSPGWQSVDPFNLFGQGVVFELGLRPNILRWAFSPTIAPQNTNFSLVSEEKKWGFDLLSNERTEFLTPHVCMRMNLGPFITAAVASFPRRH